MIEFLLLLICLGVTPGPGWSNPILVTDSANTAGGEQYINMDSQGRFHMVWTGLNDEDRIGYKVFLQDGTTVFPETMISLGSHNSILSEVVMGDSLIVFWRDFNPIYYAIRSLEDGSEITPATYLFSTSTLYPVIRACADSLGRLHVLYNIGSDVMYSVWTPAPGSGFITEYEWKIDGASAGGVLLVDGNRVHIVVQDPINHDYCYVQYDLAGNTVVPLVDFTPGGNINCSRFPELVLDTQGNLMVIEDVSESYTLWKLDKTSGATLIDEKVIVSDIPPDMYVSGDFILRNLPGTGQYYLAWCNYGLIEMVVFLLMDEDGNIIQDWQTAYDYSDEDPEDIKSIDGVVDAEGNLYIVYSQGDTIPDLGRYPAFGWFNHDYLSVEDTATAVQEAETLTISQNPVQGGVLFSLVGSQSMSLRVFDLSGREVADFVLSEGSAFWNGTSSSGKKLPTGVYTVVGSSGILKRLTLLSD